MAALATAILRGSTSAQHLEEILSRGVEVADLGFRDPLGRSLIHLAAESNDVSALRWLLQEHGANPRAGTVSEGDKLGGHFRARYFWCGVIGDMSRRQPFFSCCV